MHSFSRRSFLHTSLAGFAAGATLAPPLLSALLAADEESRASQHAAASSLFLTWWTDPTTTMVIQWVGEDMQGAPKVTYAARQGGDGEKSASVKSHPFPGTELKVYRCELEGLTPGTEYQFRIDQQAALHRFRTMPAKANDTIKFISGGDAGTGSHAIASNIIAAAQEPYFAFIGGDLAYDNGTSPSTFLTFLQNYSKHMIDPEGRLIPLLSCLGNHEVSGGRMRRSDAASYLSVFDGLYRETSYGVMDVGDYLSLVMLDTNHLSPIAGAQTDWLAQTLAERQERSHLMVANHVPAYPSYRAYPGTGEANRKHWSPLFEKYNVDVVLEHHDHTFKRTHPMKDGLRDKYGVLYLGDGSWGKLRAPHKPEDRPYLATWSMAYHVTLHRLEGNQRFHVALEESGKVADVCMTENKRPAKRG